MDYYDEIAKVAYDIFEREGKIHGRHLDHWVEAEIIVTTKYRHADKTEHDNPEVLKPKTKTATKTATKAAVKKSESKPKAPAKTTAKPKAKKTT